MHGEPDCSNTKVEETAAATKTANDQSTADADLKPEGPDPKPALNQPDSEIAENAEQIIFKQVKTHSVTIGRRPPKCEAPSPSLQPISAIPRPSLKSTPSLSHPSSSYFSPTLAPVISNTRSTSPSNLDAEDDLSDVEPTVAPASILLNSAYADASAAPALPIPLQEQKPVVVDLDLGQIKAVSRDHARLYYDKNTAAWLLEVRGRNGVVVDGKWRAKSEIIVMQRRTKIQIAERIFYFTMPNNVSYNPIVVDRDLDTESDSWSSDGEVSVSSDDLESTISDLPAPVPLLLSQSQPRIKLHVPKSPERVVPPSRASNRQRRMPSKLTADYRVPAEDGEEAAEFPSLDGDAGEEDEVDGMSRLLSGPMRPGVKKGPKKGKPADSRKAKNAKKPARKGDTDGNEPPNAVAGPSAGEVPPIPSRPLAANGEINEHVGKPDKPPYSFAALVAQAIYHCAPKKLSSAAICEWVAAHYPWFAINKDKVAWQNSIQQNLTVHSIFLKVPRGSDEPGKGNFWLMDDKLKHTFDGVNFTVQPAKRNSGYGSGSRAADKAKGIAAPRKKAVKAATSAAVTPPKPQPQPTVVPVAVPVSKPLPPPAPAARPVASSSTLTPVNAAAVLPVAIKVGPIPPDYVPPNSTAPTIAQGEVAMELAREPPIVMYHGTLILNPAIFSHLKQEQLNELSKLGASKAIGSLQGYIVTYYKEKMRKIAAAKAESSANAAAAAAAAAPSSSATAAKRKAEDTLEQQAAKKQAISTSTAASAAAKPLPSNSVALTPAK